jgi:ATP-dependent RNA helicase RhlE
MTPLTQPLGRIPAPTDAMADAKRCPTTSRITQRAYRVAHERKTTRLTAMLRQSEMRSVLVFVQRTVDANHLARAVARSGVRVAALHTDNSQDERTAAIEAFRSGDCTVLVATDGAGHTLTVPRISHVINFDIPSCSADYHRRIGRVARAATPGAAIAFVAPDEEARFERILADISVAVTSAGTTPGDVGPSSGLRRRRARRRARRRRMLVVRRAGHLHEDAVEHRRCHQREQHGQREGADHGDGQRA